MSPKIASLSSEFIWRRIHSLMGFWLIVYLVEHLLVNSQAALWIGDDGHGFVKLVNLLESIPYLQVVEILLIGIPLGIHGIWGISRALSSKTNVQPSAGHRPSLPFARNWAYTAQRLSSWILLIGICFHVAQMRFLDYPKKAIQQGQEFYFVKLDFDSGLYTLAERLQVSLYSAKQVKEIGQQNLAFLGSSQEIEFYEPSEEQKAVSQQSIKQKADWYRVLSSFELQDHQVVAVASQPGVSMLLTVRDTFKSVWMRIFYTLFVLAAVFHAMNGLWTFLITWGVILTYSAQKRMIPVTVLGMILLSSLGLAAIWASYLINLRS